MNLCDRPVIFYSTIPQDVHSRKILELLDQNEALKKQITLIQINKKDFVIPKTIREINKIPILVMNKLDRAVIGLDILTWLKNAAYKDKSNGYDYYPLNEQVNYVYINGNEDRNSGNKFYNKGYNKGFENGYNKRDNCKNNVKNNMYSNLTDNNHITTYSTDKNKLSSNDMARSMQCTDRSSNRLDFTSNACSLSMIDNQNPDFLDQTTDSLTYNPRKITNYDSRSLLKPTNRSNNTNMTNNSETSGRILPFNTTIYNQRDSYL
jgi:hypothetical protein